MADDEADSESVAKLTKTSSLLCAQPTNTSSSGATATATTVAAMATAPAPTATSAAFSSWDKSKSPRTSTSTSAGNANVADFKEDASGVKSIVIERSEYGFGFTLRHFIVYPPESSAILAGDRHLGFRRPATPNEPIDTIFVKNVRENGPAHSAGLATGDRIISVNGQDIGGLSYLRVVNLIFRTKDSLRLAVVPQQNDALQLYFGQVAHHPESNRKPRECLAADVASNYDRSTSMISSNTRHYAPRSDSSSPYSSLSLHCDSTSSSSALRQQQQQSMPRPLDPPSSPPFSPIANERASCCGIDATTTTTTTTTKTKALTPSSDFNVNCACTVDVEFERNNCCDSMSDSSMKDYLACDDSVVMNRLRKSLEQKQEFLNRLPCWTAAATAAAPETAVAAAADPSSASPFTSQSAAVNSKSPFASPTSPTQNPNHNCNVAVTVAPPPPPPFQVVSVRAKQFENGPFNDRTELFRSELARISVVKNAVDVATRKRDLECRVQLDQRNLSTRGPDVNVNANAAVKQSAILHVGQAAARSCAGNSSGNQIIPIGSNKLHCEPPSEFHSVFQTKRQDDDKATRRISYLKATTAYCMNIDSENENQNENENDVDDADPVPTTITQRSVLGSRKIAETCPPDQENRPVIKEGNVFCKVIQVEGKKASDRSWKPIWLILKGSSLYLLKEKKESLFTETPATFEKSDLGASCDRLDIRCSVVEVANDYTKRKHVLRLNAPSVGTELLLQAQDAICMGEWVRVLQEQAVASSTSTLVEAAPMPVPVSVSTNFSSSTSPSACNKTLRKLASLRTRSPTGDVPSAKSKKPMPNDYQQTSPKTKTWKNKMAKQLRKIQPGANSPVSSTAASAYPAGATIGVPLELCPSSTFSEYVPLIVQVCTSIVETKGLEIIGIYRVPGNTAAVTSLTEAVNRGLEMTALDQDPRWCDVNVISSLLKSFFRKLPDALLTSELYPNFIKSDAIEDAVQRMVAIRKLVHDLPDHNFETLKYLLLHLKKVVANSAVNKMEARNLAIVFGPTLIRSGDDMFTMVTDMSHQCRIVESLLSHVDWCFGDGGDVNELKLSIPDTNCIPELEATSSNHTLLLGNIRKVEECMQSPTTAKDFVSTIIGAANRKMHKTSKHLMGSTGTGNGSSSSASGAGGKKSTVTAACTNYASSSGSADALDSTAVAIVPSIPVATKNAEKKKKTVASVPVPVESKTETMDTAGNANIADGVASSRHVSDGNGANEDQVLWTYPKLSAETKERIRKFEEETEALLQRCTNPRRLSGCISEEMWKEKALSKSDRTIHDSPPPVVVARRNLPNVCATATATATATDHGDWKKSHRVGEFIRSNSREKSTSLESLNRMGRPSSRHSDDGCDLLITLTSTFDKKLKSLSNDTSLCEKAGDTVSKSQFISRAQVDRNCSFRDPSLHRNVEKWCRMDTIRKLDTNTTDKENDQHDEEKEKKDVDEKETQSSWSPCDCAVAHSETIQQNCDNWKRSVLQDLRSQQNRGAGSSLDVGVKRGDTKLFYSNSVKLRRSGSLKEDGATIKLRRSGSLNKHEPSTKVSKFECLMLTKNADAIKLRRADSLTKSEKTETNLKRRQQGHGYAPALAENSRKIRGNSAGGGGGDKEGKLKRRNGVSKCRNIKRRHTVGGTKDFDKVSWLHNYQQRDDVGGLGEADKENRRERRTSSPDLNATKATTAAPDFLVPAVVRPTSFIAAATDPNFVSRLLNIPLESHV